MPLDKTIRKVLVIGSGPIVIGQAAEFDYAGTQACRVLRGDGIEIILVNSNPATIMTDNAMADKIYLEPLTKTTVRRIIEKERPDSILSGLGGQTGLTLCMQLARDGTLAEFGVRLLGSSPETIDKAEDRRMFKDTMEEIGQPVIPSVVATDVGTAVAFADAHGYPVIVRPAFTLGGSGGGIVDNEKQLRETAANGIKLSPIGQILVEISVAGWKEIEFEVMRDKLGNVVAVCSMENFDPVGIHTGDSIVIAPAVTLADKEYQMLRSAALDIIGALKVEGGCNVQFALNPGSFEYRVIEVNPRVSRSSALASKATGYPIAKVATKIAIGYTLDEIPNAVTGKTFAAFEPALDYVAVKFPKWPFDKFVYAKRELGTQMKATGEVMAISDKFETALLKAVRGAEISRRDLNHPVIAAYSDEQLRAELSRVTDERLFVLYEALRRGYTADALNEITAIDRWFLNKLRLILESEAAAGISAKPSADGVLPKPERSEDLSEQAHNPVFKMVDTCAGEFEATTPYFYAIPDGDEDEAAPFVLRSTKPRMIVLGSGPIRIGQGIEFDYACVHCVWTLKSMGYEVIIINNNPETVSTDFDTADRLYFEPLTIEDVMRVVETERPEGVIVAFGGGTAIKLAPQLEARGVKIVGTSADTIDICEDRSRFDALLENLDLKRPRGLSVRVKTEALAAGAELGYPVLLRPSYVLGGQNMIIAWNDADVSEYMDIILREKQDNPVLIDKYLSGREVEVDAICDGGDILIPGIMEHIERTGIHSGDSIAVYPNINIGDALADKIYEETRKLCLATDARGLINIQYILIGEEIWVIEVNPRASRTVPYLSKVTGINMCDVATRCSLGITLRAQGLPYGIYRVPPYTCVKVPVFSFEKLTDVDVQLGPEMKSTGEVLGIGKNLKEALYKGLIAAGYKMQRKGGVMFTVRRQDKREISKIARKYAQLGFELYATAGTAMELIRSGLRVTPVNKISESDRDNSMTVIESGKLAYIISTSEKGRDPATDDVKIRRRATTLGIPCLTSLDTADALAEALLSGYTETNTELVDINAMRSERMKLEFTKMHGSGNDYIYINSWDRDINCPESLSVILADRHAGIGGDGVILIMRSGVPGADARMRMFNMDGSEGSMCGNGIRCVAKYLYDNKIVEKDEMTIETKAGLRSLRVFTKDGRASHVRVNMGKAELNPKLVPVNLDGESVIARRVEIGGEDYEITAVSMGNPHAVVFVPETDSLDLEKIGPLFEHNTALFPDRVNTEFIKVVDERNLKMRVWERGSGETRACGTGTCASVVAAALNGFVPMNEDIRVSLPGGELVINYTEDAVFMTGDCVKVFDGVIEL
ncbi:MAG: carbamoyl-phosphate synthase large subunit [Oscillospiraceae bacterium]|jgi:carbamoyl-phosphate synthase large subunit|nr:carbamoyl-phosphate synthase large subunit [Oscillospiraceae bacterium]